MPGGGHLHHRSALLFNHSWPTAHPASSPCGLQAGERPLPREFALQLRDCTQDGEDHPTRCGTGISSEIQDPQGDACFLEVVDDRQDIAEAAAEPVQLRDDERVARAQILLAAVPLGPAGSGSTHAVVGVDVLSTGGSQGVLLCGEALGGRADSGVPYYSAAAHAECECPTSASITRCH